MNFNILKIYFYSFLLDISLLFTWGLLSKPITDQILNNLATGLGQAKTVSLAPWFALMAVLFYILWCIFQGTAWWLQQKTKYFPYMKRFAKTSAILMIPLCIWYILDLILKLGQTLSQVPEYAVSIPSGFIFGALALTAINALPYGKWKIQSKPTLIVLVSYILLEIIIRIFPTNIQIYGLILIFPWFTWIRQYMTERIK